jgi:hypothetical protein
MEGEAKAQPKKSEREKSASDTARPGKWRKKCVLGGVDKAVLMLFMKNARQGTYCSVESIDAPFSSLAKAESCWSAGRGEVEVEDALLLEADEELWFATMRSLRSDSPWSEGSMRWVPGQHV